MPTAQQGKDRGGQQQRKKAKGKKQQQQHDAVASDAEPSAGQVAPTGGTLVLERPPEPTTLVMPCSPEQAVGRSVLVWFYDEDDEDREQSGKLQGAFYPGKITGYNPETGMHTLVYPDEPEPTDSQLTEDEYIIWSGPDLASSDRVITAPGAHWPDPATVASSPADLPKEEQAQRVSSELQAEAGDAVKARSSLEHTPAGSAGDAAAVVHTADPVGRGGSPGLAAGDGGEQKHRKATRPRRQASLPNQAAEEAKTPRAGVTAGGGGRGRRRQSKSMEAADAPGGADGSGGQGAGGAHAEALQGEGGAALQEVKADAGAQPHMEAGTAQQAEVPPVPKPAVEAGGEAEAETGCAAQQQPALREQESGQQAVREGEGQQKDTPSDTPVGCEAAAPTAPVAAAVASSEQQRSPQKVGPSTQPAADELRSTEQTPAVQPDAEGMHRTEQVSARQPAADGTEAVIDPRPMDLDGCAEADVGVVHAVDAEPGPSQHTEQGASAGHGAGPPRSAKRRRSGTPGAAADAPAPGAEAAQYAQEGEGVAAGRGGAKGPGRGKKAGRGRGSVAAAAGSTTPATKKLKISVTTARTGAGVGLLATTPSAVADKAGAAGTTPSSAGGPHPAAPDGGTAAKTVPQATPRGEGAGTTGSSAQRAQHAQRREGKGAVASEAGGLQELQRLQDQLAVHTQQLSTHLGQAAAAAQAASRVLQLLRDQRVTVEQLQATQLAAAESGGKGLGRAVAQVSKDVRKLAPPVGTVLSHPLVAAVLPGSQLEAAESSLAQVHAAGKASRALVDEWKAMADGKQPPGAAAGAPPVPSTTPAAGTQHREQAERASSAQQRQQQRKKARPSPGAKKPPPPTSSTAPARSSRHPWRWSSARRPAPGTSSSRRAAGIGTTRCWCWLLRCRRSAARSAPRRSWSWPCTSSTRRSRRRSQLSVACSRRRAARRAAWGTCGS